MFDYITLAIIVILALGILIGFIRGGFNMLSGIAILAAAILVAVFFSKLLANAFLSGPVGTSLNQTFFTFLAGKIDFDVAGVYHVTGNTSITEAELNAMTAAGKVYYADPNFDVLHLAYQNVSLPAALYATVDGLLHDAIAAYGGSPFVLAQPLADILTNGTCYVISFVILFIGTWIVGAILVAIIRGIAKLAHPKPSIISRVVGAVAGLAIAAGIVWAGCLVLNVLMMMDNDVSVHLKAVMQYDDPNAWTLGKWLCQLDLGYNAIISFVIK
ncbi:MAG: CvpA family protein [Bacilli bacterium]|nr:CvpA family protein [Bacilli bacterium]